MKLADIRRDNAAIEQGEWVGEKHGTPLPDMGDLCVKVRGIGNSDFRRLQAKLVDAVPRNKRQGGRVDAIEMDRIISICLRDTCLVDWDGLEDGPYSKDLAGKLLTDPDYRAFRDAVLFAASSVGEARAERAEQAAGNSPGGSSGT